MNDQYFFSITKTIKRVFIYPHNINSGLHDLWKRAKNRSISEEEALSRFVSILEKLKKLPTKQTSDSYKSSSVLQILGDFSPKNILDIGAGEGIIAESVGNAYNLEKESIYAIDLQEINNQNITVLGYINGKVPLPDSSIDLVMLMSVLHHIDPVNRLEVIKEAARLLSKNGKIFIREHDDNKEYEFRIYLQFIHYIWYVVYNETHDPLYLMTRAELYSILEGQGLVLDKEKISNVGNQRIYEVVFKKSIID